MKTSPGRQKGASAIGTVIILAVMAYAVFFGIQYVPQFIESKSIDSILRTMESSQKADPVNSELEARAKITSLLQAKQMNEMTKNLSIRSLNGNITIKFAYDRKLHLGYKKRAVHYEKLLVLN